MFIAVLLELPCTALTAPLARTSWRTEGSVLGTHYSTPCVRELIL